jgi:signal transduction histidine kinase
MSRPTILTPSRADLDAIHREATDQLGIGSYRFLMDGTIVFMDRIILQILDLEERFTPDDVVGMQIGDLFGYVEEPSSFRETVLEQGKVLNHEYRYRTLTDKEGWVSHNAYVVRDEGSGQTAIQVIGHDITARKRLERERHALEARMQQTQKLESLGVLAGGIAHDFNNLLTGILGYAGLCKEDVDPDSKIWERLGLIERGARQAAELTSEMLAYSGRGQFVVAPIQLSTLTLETSQLLHTAVSRKAHLRFELQPELPPVMGDAAQLRQVVMNLITNASDALEDDIGMIRVHTSAVQATEEDLRNPFFELENPRPGPHVCLEVEDTGCGMDPATLSRMFEPFFSTKFTGRGLGLAAVLGIVRGHDGSLQVDSTPGTGTHVRVLIPIHEHAVEEHPAPASEGRLELERAVLVVDDEATIRDLARTVLEDQGLTVLTANDGAEAVELFLHRQDEIGLVILDLTMPELDGAEVFRRLRDTRRDLPVVLTSGYSEQHVQQLVGEDRLDGFLQKPYPPSELIDAVRRAIR